MDYLVAQEPQVHYAEVRPMHLWKLPELKQAVEHAGVTMDCSWSVTELCYLAGLADPNGRGYDGSGDTQVMFDHLPRYTRPTGASTGALCFFGIPGELSTQHVTMVRHPSPDPVLFSHGQERGPVYLPFSVESRYHEGSPVFLSIAAL